MSNSIGGTERVVQNLAAALIQRSLDVQTVLADGPNVDATLAWYREAGVEATASPAVRTSMMTRPLGNIAALGRLVRQSNADVVGIHYPDLWFSAKDVFAIKFLARKRCFVSTHHPTPFMSRQKRMMTCAAAFMSDAVVTPTRILRDTLISLGVPKSKMRSVGYGVPVPENMPSRAEARARLGLSPECFVVTVLARLIKEKGVGDLIQALARTPDPDHLLRLLIVGDGPERVALEDQVRETLGKRAFFLGRVTETSDIYAAADVFCLPSHHEGFGLVYVEAAFYGVPSVGTDIGGIPEAVTDGQTGLLVPVGAIDALAKTLQRLRDDSELRHKLGEAARKRAYAELSAPVMAERYEKVLFN